MALDVRRLTARYEAAFVASESGAPEQDLDDTYVELDRWAVSGTFEQGRLVCAASVYCWEGVQITDTDVPTLPASGDKGPSEARARPSSTS